MPFVFVKSKYAYKSTLYWKNLTIIKTYVHFLSYFGGHFEKNGLFQPKYLIWIPDLTIFDYCVPIGNRKILFIMILKKSTLYILAHPYYWYITSTGIQTSMCYWYITSPGIQTSVCCWYITSPGIQMSVCYWYITFLGMQTTVCYWHITSTGIQTSMC